MSTVTAEERVKELTKLIQHKGYDAVGRVLREQVLPLIEAGQGMRDCNYINTANSIRWDAALERLGKS